MHTPHPREVRQQAQRFAEEHAADLAAEILEWQDTGLLRAGAKLHDLAAIWSQIDVTSALNVAESTAVRAALKLAARSAKQS